MSSSLPERVLALPALWVREGERRHAEKQNAEPAILTDEEALTRLKAGDQEAMTVVFARYANLVFAIGFRILRDHGEAEDLVQNVFLYLWQRAELYDAERGSAKSWIVQKAWSRALDRRDFLVHRQFNLGTDAEVGPDTLAGSFDLEREVMSNLNRVELLKAIQELPEKQALVLKLSFYEGLELREIGERLGDSFASVRHHYYRGLDKLRKNARVRDLGKGLKS
jgi:RNA polymerase sigma-70 factor, ECF subfamily